VDHRVTRLFISTKSGGKSQRVVWKKRLTIVNTFSNKLKSERLGEGYHERELIELLLRFLTSSN